jgi:hypothetical protein
MIWEGRIKRLTLCLFAVCAAMAVAAPAASAIFELGLNGHLRHETNSYVGFNVKHTSSGSGGRRCSRAGGCRSAATPSSGTTQFLTLHDSFRIVKGVVRGQVACLHPPG